MDVSRGTPDVATKPKYYDLTREFKDVVLEDLTPHPQTPRP